MGNYHCEIITVKLSSGDNDMKGKFLAAAAALGLSGGLALVLSTPAHAAEFLAVTPSGSTEMLFGEDQATALAKLANRCIESKWPVVSTTASEVVCEVPMSSGQQILGQFLMGNSYSTPPRRFYKFNAVSFNGITRVQAAGWMELQMAFGQINRNDFSGPDFHNAAIIFMGHAGGKLPVGTTFPNHVYMGFDNEDTQVKGSSAFNVTIVEPNMPAEKAGLRVGDVITRIAGKKWKNESDYMNAIAKAAKTSTYPVEILRDGKPMTLTLERAFRPAITEEVVAIAPKTPVAATASASAPVSVADELTKLAKLKTDGIITEEEFTTQKALLLKPATQN